MADPPGCLLRALQHLHRVRRHKISSQNTRCLGVAVGGTPSSPQHRSLGSINPGSPSHPITISPPHRLHGSVGPITPPGLRRQHPSSLCPRAVWHARTCSEPWVYTVNPTLVTVVPGGVGVCQPHVKVRTHSPAPRPVSGSCTHQQPHNPGAEVCPGPPGQPTPVSITPAPPCHLQAKGTLFHWYIYVHILFFLAV